MYSWFLVLCNYCTSGIRLTSWWRKWSLPTRDRGHRIPRSEIRLPVSRNTSVWILRCILRLCLAAYVRIQQDLSTTSSSSLTVSKRSGSATMKYKNLFRALQFIMTLELCSKSRSPCFTAYAMSRTKVSGWYSALSVGHGSTWNAFRCQAHHCKTHAKNGLDLALALLQQGLHYQ